MFVWRCEKVNGIPEFKHTVKAEERKGDEPWEEFFI